MNYNEMHPTFWNSLTLIDHNFGTKSLIDLKQKNIIKLRFRSFLLCYNLSFGTGKLNFGIQASIPPLNTDFSSQFRIFYHKIT